MLYQRSHGQWRQQAQVRYLSLAVYTGQGVLSPVLVELPLRLPVQRLSVVILIKALLQVVVTTL